MMFGTEKKLQKKCSIHGVILPETSKARDGGEGKRIDSAREDSEVPGRNTCVWRPRGNFGGSGDTGIRRKKNFRKEERSKQTEGKERWGSMYKRQ